MVPPGILTQRGPPRALSSQALTDLGTAITGSGPRAPVDRCSLATLALVALEPVELF